MKKMEILPKINELSINENEKKLKKLFKEKSKDLKNSKEIEYFIPTDEAISRLYQLESNLTAGNHVLLEGPTGSSKTKTVQIYCIIKDLDLVQFNMSGETNEEDLKGRTLSDINSFSGFKFKKGHFADAFINGKILLLDEINLANQGVLNFIANALDSKMLVLEHDENTKDASNIFPMHKKFRLVATQNPNDISYICKREDIPEKLLQLFNIINFPSLTDKEIKEIAKEIAKKNNYENEEVIDAIADIHSDLIKSKIENKSHKCFTIRDINSIIKAISRKKNPNSVIDALMCFYGMRFEKGEREKFYNMLMNNEKLPKEISEYKFPEKIYNNFFLTKSFEQADKYAKIAYENGKHILFTGREGVGITSIAKLISSRYSRYKNKDFTFVFTEETTIGDLIGRFIPTSSSKKAENNIIEWKNGPLTEAIINGYSGLFLNIDLVEPKILERINCLLDEKEKESDNKFQIIENPNLNEISIDNNFRFYCTCTIDRLDSLSDAFSNRLTIIMIDDQLEEIKKDKNKYKQLVKNLMEQENFKIKLDEKLISELADTLYDSNMSMSEISRLVKCCLRLSNEFPDIEPKENINYIKTLLGKFSDINIPLKISENQELQNKLKAYKKKIFGEETFYIGSQNIINLIINMYVCMICKVNICLVGKTGLGKTHLARTFAKIFRGDYEKELTDILFTFNSESNLENLYGTFAFEGGNTTIKKGPLYNAIEEGLIFIADEFNLAEESVIQSFANVLEVNFQSSKILIPGINQTIPYHKNSFIIICQNDSRTKGRKMLPNSIKKKIKIFEYPQPTYIDIARLSESIIENEIGDNFKLNKNLAEKLSKLMISLNEKYIPEVGSWSMRDIRKIFRRISHQTNFPNDYKNIKEIHQILIYILGGVPKNKVLNIFEEVILLMKSPFILEEKEINDLRKMVDSKAEKVEFFVEDKKQIYIMKGEYGKRFIPETELPDKEFNSFYESLFFANFSDVREPLLIWGPSGYKTFLSKKISKNDNVINLYPETSLSQLLGSTHIRDNLNAKKYYLKEILSICDKTEEYKNLEEMLEKYFQIEEKTSTLNKTSARLTNPLNLSKQNENFKDIINNMKYFVKLGENNIGEQHYENKALNKILSQLKKNLLNIKNQKGDEKNRFGNFTSYFQAGRILQDLFKQKYIILKGVDSLLPNVLERFNELLNYNPKIILNEDLYNTFTDKNKEINGISENFRIIGISSSDNINNFSEASRSRFTLISTSKYTKDEKTLLIKKLCPNCPVNFNEIFIKNYEKDREEEISFKVINKILNLYKKLNNEEKKNTERNMILAIYYSIISFLNENDVDNFIKILKDAFKEQKTFFNINANNNKFINFEFYYSLDNQNDENPFSRDNDRIFSKGTGLSLLIQNKNNNDNSEYFNNNYDFDNIEPNYDNEISGIYFHQSFKDLLDAIHFSLVIHFPLIIEGETGTGKNLAIEYVSNKLNYKLIKYQITESTTIEDLFGKEKIQPNKEEIFIFEETELYKTVLETNEKEYDETNSIILLENIEEASQSILEALIQLFDSTEPSILLPYGNEGKKKPFNLIVTYDPSKHNYSFQNFFPPQILNNSLIFKFNVSTENDYKEIFFSFSRDKESFDIEEGEKIVNEFIISKNYISNIQENKLYSINDLKKYDILENQISCVSKEIDKNDILRKLIFISPLSNKKQIIELENKLFYINMNYDIRLQFDEQLANFTIFPRLKEKDFDGPKYKFSEKDNYDENYKKIIEEDFNELNDYQKLGMMFLLFGINSNYTCIIQGPFCSGKTHLVKTFAKLCKEKLEIIDLSCESNLSLLTGQLIPLSKINNKNIKKIQNQLKKLLKTIHELKNILNDNNFKVESPDEWTPKQFDDIISELEKLESKYLNSLKPLIKAMKNERKLTAFLEDKESIFISAMKEGKWVLLNGIELAQPELYQKLISLCDISNKSLNLFEKGRDYNYISKENYENNLNEKFIHKNFRLFITYNPYSVEMNKRLSPGFLNKCLVYTLFPIDNDIKNASLFLSNLIKKNEIFADIHNELATKIATIHFNSKELCEKDKNNSHGKKYFSGRTLLSFINYINIQDVNFEEQIIRAINDCYCNCFQNKKEIKELFFNIYSSQPNKGLIEYLTKKEESFSKKYPTFMKELQEYINTNSIEDFINLCLTIEFTDIQNLLKLIKTYNFFKFLDKFVTHWKFIFEIICNILNAFINNEEVKDKIISKKIGAKDLKEKSLLMLQYQFEILKKLYENNYLKPIENFDSIKEKEGFLTDLIKSNSIEEYIKDCFIFPNLMNKIEAQKLTKDSICISEHVAKGEVSGENVIPLIQELNKILNDPFSLCAINNDNYTEALINKIIKEEIKYENFEEKIGKIKLNFISEKNNEINNKSEIDSIFDSWIEKYNELKNKIIEKKGNNENRNLINKELEKYKQLLGNKKKGIPEEEEKYYNIYIESLEKMVNQYTIDINGFKNIKKNFLQFIDLLKNKISKNDKDEYFHFQYSTDFLDYNMSECNENLKIIDSLIDYSKVRVNLEKIRENEDKIKCVKEIFHILNSEKKLETIVKDFFNLILSSGNKKIKDEIDEFESQYKSFLLIKHGVKLMDKNNIINYLNNLSKRNTFDQKDLRWGTRINSLKYEPKFEIEIPEFTPKDILGLFIIKNIINKNEEKGFYLKEIILKDCKNYLVELGKYLNQKIDCFSECLNILINVFLEKFQIIHDKKDGNWDISDIDKIVVKEKSEHNKKYLNKIKELFEVVKDMEKKGNTKLIYDDFFFLEDKNWYLNKNINSLKYPSLCFLFIKNKRLEEDYIKYFSDYKYEKKASKFPLYFLLLRIFSHKDIIKCDDYKEDKNKISKFIKEKLNSLIKEYLKKNFPKDINWIGLFTTDFFKRRTDSLMNEVRNYLFNYSIFNGNEIDVIKELLEKEIINFIFTNTVEGKIEDFFNNKLDDNNKTFQLIRPRNIIEEIIARKKTDLANDFENKSQKCFELLINLNKDEIASEFYNNFMTIIEETMRTRKSELQNDYKQKIININNQKILNFESKTSQFISIFNNLKSFNNEINEYNRKSKILIDYYNDLKEYDIFEENEELTVGLIEFKNINIEKGDKILLGKEKININNIKSKEKSYFYYNLRINENFPDITINDNLIDYNNLILNKANIKKLSAQKKNDELEKLKKNSQKEQEKNNNIKEPILVFINSDKPEENFKFQGDYPENDETFKSILDLLDLYIKVIQNIDLNNKIYYIDINENIKNLRKKFEITFNFDRSQFEDGVGDTNKINDKITKFNQFKTESKSRLDEFLKIYEEYERSKSKFQLPKELNKFNLPKNSDIRIKYNDNIFIDINDKNVDYFVSLSNDEKIHFHSGEYIKCIGPIIPEFYKNQKYIFQIFSFINKNINVKLEKTEGIEYFDCLDATSFVESLKPIQLSFIVPEKTVEEPTEDYISFNIILNLEGEIKEKCIIKCLFYIQLLPLNIYISSSKGLFFIQKDILKLNIGSIFEDENIKLKFDIPNFKEYDIFKASYYVKNLKKNTAKKPSLNFIKENHSLEIKVDRYEKNHNYLHFLLYFYITEDLKIKIEIETIIFKLEYILIFTNIYDEYRGLQKENYIIWNKKDSNPSLEIHLLDQKEATIYIAKKKNKEYNPKVSKLKIKSPYNLDLKEINELYNYLPLKMTLMINNEELKFTFVKSKSLSTYSRHTSEDIKNEIVKYKISIMEKRKAEEVKYNGIKNLNKNIRFSSAEKNPLYGIKEYDKDYDTSIFTQLDAQNENSLNGIESKNNIDQLKIEDLNTINDYISFYQKLTDILQTLPYLIKLDNYPVDKMKKLLNFVYEIYQNSKNYKYCIISRNIIYYMKSFEDTYKILSQSGIQFPTKIIKNKDEILEKNTFVPNQKPNIYELHLRDKTTWNDELFENLSYLGSNIEKSSDEEKEIIYKEVENYKDNDIIKYNKKGDIIKNNKQIDKKDNKIELERTRSLELSKTNNIIQKNKLIPEKLKKNEYSKGNSSFMFEKRPEKEIIQKEIPKPEYSPINYEFESKININTNLTGKQLEYLKTDKNGLKNAIRRMLDSKIEEISAENLSKESNDFNNQRFKEIFNKEVGYDNDIKNLEKISILLILQFLKSTILSLNNYTNTSFIIAIDCCRNINIKEKLINLILIISLSKCFFYLEIPFSIIIFSDYKFQYIVKNFYEPFSINIIQRLYDCIIVERFFSRIFDVCYYIEKNIDFPKENKMAIIISNGIDYSLKLGLKWKKYFEKKIKFCFFFNNSNIPNLEEIRKIWEKFEKETEFPIIEFNSEVINATYFDLSKYQKILNSFVDEKIEIKDVYNAGYCEFFDYYIEKLNSEYKDIDLYFSQDDKVFVQINQREKPIQNIILSQSNIINCYGIKASENNCNCESFLKEFDKNIPIYNQKLIDDMFPPNKPTLYAPSSKGTKLNFSGLLNFFITNGQDDKIWLEKKDRLKKDYRVSIIIDSSLSCFNKDSFYYSFSIIKSFLNIIYFSKIPFFDLIIATNKEPLVICSGQDSNILNNKSFIWPLIISQISDKKTYESNEISCKLYDAIYTALQIKIQQTSKKFFCFVLTDGIFNESYKSQLKNLCSFCEYSQINLFGIGIGLYPEGLPDIFSKCLWSPDIKYFSQALSSLLKNEKIFSMEFNLKFENDKKRINLQEDMEKCINKISEHNLNHCRNKNLYNFLNGVEVHIESLKEIMNIDPLYKDLSLTNPENSEKTSMFKKGFFKNFKILICCFWSKSISSKLERDEVDYKYLTKRFNKKKNCLADVIGYYGIEKKDIKVVVNYEQGIQEMKTGKYYATWIICGNGRGDLPDKGNANLVGQFINCTIRYWKKGGSLVWWCDNQPLCFEFNLFMNNDYNEFPGKNKNNFKFGGNNKGATLMVAGDINKNPIQRFNNQRYFKLGNLGNSLKEGKYSVPALGHGLSKIAIGTTVSYAQNIKDNSPLKKPEEVQPFIPFAYDDEGCITILFYISPLDSDTGNIVVDGGFSKLFTELDTEGTGKYIQNIVGLTSSYHKHLDRDGENWIDNFSLPSFEQDIDYKEKFNGFVKKITTKEYDIIYMIDATGSMESWIDAAADRCLNISEELKLKFPHLEFYFGGIFYRDPIDSKEDVHEVFDLTNNITELKNNFKNIKAEGGGDDPEDWVGAYEKAINSINWKDGTKLIIHIADASAHTKEFFGQENHEEEAGKLPKMLSLCAQKGIKIIGFSIEEKAKKSFDVCEEYYKKFNGFYKVFCFNEAKYSTISENFEDLVIEAAECAAPKTREIWGSNFIK